RFCFSYHLLFYLLVSFYRLSHFWRLLFLRLFFLLLFNRWCNRLFLLRRLNAQVNFIPPLSTFHHRALRQSNLFAFAFSEFVVCKLLLQSIVHLLRKLCVRITGVNLKILTGKELHESLLSNIEFFSCCQ